MEIDWVLMTFCLFCCVGGFSFRVSSTVVFECLRSWRSNENPLTGTWPEPWASGHLLCNMKERQTRKIRAKNERTKEGKNEKEEDGPLRLSILWIESTEGVR